MFRKNFREGGGGGKSGGGGGGGLKGSKSFSSGRNANKQRARDMSLSLQDDVHYRTHLFFSPSNRPCYDNEGESVAFYIYVLLKCRLCPSIFIIYAPALAALFYSCTILLVLENDDKFAQWVSVEVRLNTFARIWIGLKEKPRELKKWNEFIWRSAPDINFWLTQCRKFN